MRPATSTAQSHRTVPCRYPASKCYRRSLTVAHARVPERTGHAEIRHRRSLPKSIWKKTFTVRVGCPRGGEHQRTEGT